MDPHLHDVVEFPGRPWTVSCVCDARGGGADLAFTVGLHSLGLPELLVRARPTEGDDPGADWRLSHRDLADCLDDLAELLVAGDLTPGTRADLPVDAGMATVSFLVRPETVGAAVGIPELAALGERGLPDDRFVLPVGWSLRRPPPDVATLPPPDPTTARLALARLLDQAETLRAEILARGGRPGPVPAAWRPPAEPTLDPGLRFGPLHALVLARGRQVLLGDVTALTRFADAALDLGPDLPGEVLGPLPTLAAAAGRTPALAALDAAAAEITDLLAGAGGTAARWRDVVTAQRHRVCRDHRAGLADLVRHALWHHLHGLLAAEAFADVLPAALVRAGRRSWLTALHTKS